MISWDWGCFKMGFNAEGFIKPSSNSDYIKKLEARIAELENTKQRKRKRKIDFSGILGEVSAGNLPWEF